MENETRCGFVAIVGRPNVGKSTLLNRILGQKISITSRKPQTTRQQIFGIKTQDNVQAIYVDTPGIQGKEPRVINRYMNRAALSSLHDVEVVVFIVDARVWNSGDDLVLSRLQNSGKPVIIALNKVDKIGDKKSLLPIIDNLKDKMDFSMIIPLSAKEGTGVEELEKAIASYFKPAPFYYDKDQVTNRDQSFQVAEIIREKLIRNLGQELPYSTAVEIDEMKTDNNIVHINAIIWVEREGQKAIVIGKEGLHMKRIATDARKDIEKRLGSKVFLRVWVKCKDNWSDNERSLQQLGLGS